MCMCNFQLGVDYYMSREHSCLFTLCRQQCVWCLWWGCSWKFQFIKVVKVMRKEYKHSFFFVIIVSYYLVISALVKSIHIYILFIQNQWLFNNMEWFICYTSIFLINWYIKFLRCLLRINVDKAWEWKIIGIQKPIEYSVDCWWWPMLFSERVADAWGG